jgi:hypothetical protein
VPGAERAEEGADVDDERLWLLQYEEAAAVLQLAPVGDVVVRSAKQRMAMSG